jgi:hypothetical protein
LDAAQVLNRNTDNQHAFWFNNGFIARSLRDLVSGLESCSPETFSYHVNEQKNDFANWVNDIVGDPVLAKRLKGCTDKKRYVVKLKRRITELSKTVA